MNTATHNTVLDQVSKRLGSGATERLQKMYGLVYNRLTGAVADPLSKQSKNLVIEGNSDLARAVDLVDGTYVAMDKSGKLEVGKLLAKEGGLDSRTESASKGCRFWMS